ncbi:unnamed protein product, partial [Prorocentrum cordatum]
ENKETDAKEKERASIKADFDKFEATLKKDKEETELPAEESDKISDKIAALRRKSCSTKTLRIWTRSCLWMSTKRRSTTSSPSTPRKKRAKSPRRTTMTMTIRSWPRTILTWRTRCPWRTHACSGVEGGRALIGARGSSRGRGRAARVPPSSPAPCSCSAALSSPPLPFTFSMVVSVAPWRGLIAAVFGPVSPSNFQLCIFPVWSAMYSSRCSSAATQTALITHLGDEAREIRRERGMCR